MSSVDPTSVQDSPDVTDSWLRRMRGVLLRRIWYVHPGAHLHIHLSPEQITYALEVASVPSTQRLHLRNVFTRGRRYHIFPKGVDRFEMMTTNKVLWHPRRRTKPTTVLSGHYQRTGDAYTWLSLHSHIRLPYLLDTFLWPTFMTSMLVFMTWPVWSIACFIAALYGLSWIVHRFTAAIEDYEMVFFIEKALADYLPKLDSALPERTADVVVDGEFNRVWEKFVDTRQDE